MRSCSAATSAKSLNCLPKTKKINKHRLIALNSHSQVLLPWKRGRNPYAVFSICSTSGHYDLYLDTTTCCVWLVNKVRDVIMIIWKQITEGKSVARVWMAPRTWASPGHHGAGWRNSAVNRGRNLKLRGCLVCAWSVFSCEHPGNRAPQSLLICC